METNSENGTDNTPTTEPAPTQPNPQNVDTEQGAKLEYDRIELCDSYCGGQHGDVYFVGGEKQPLDTFEDVERISKMLEDESSMYFQMEIRQHQNAGKLQNLLPLEQVLSGNGERQDLQARLKAMREQLFALEDEQVNLEAQSFSSFALAQGVISHLVQGLDNKPELNPVFNQLSRRGLKIMIIVDSDEFDDYEYYEKPVATQVIYPRDLVSRDIRREKAQLKAREEKLVSEIDKLVRETIDFASGRSRPKK